MRHGLAPYRGVFSAQGPLHFPLLYVGDLLGFRTIDGPRVAPMLAGVARDDRRRGRSRAASRGRRAGLIAGVLVATSGSMIWTTGQVTGDGIASALAVAAVWAALAYRDDPRVRRAIVAGLLDGRRARGQAAGRDRRAAGRLVAVVAPRGSTISARPSAPRSCSGSRPRCRGDSSRVWEQSVKYNGGAGPRYAQAQPAPEARVDAGQPRPSRRRRPGARPRHGGHRRGLAR